MEMHEMQGLKPRTPHYWVLRPVACGRLKPLCVKQLLHEAGLPALRSHDMRHSSATILISMGVNSKVVQERLGHNTVSITPGVYGHVTLIDATRGHAEMRSSILPSFIGNVVANGLSVFS